MPARLVRVRLMRTGVLTGLSAWTGCEGRWVVDRPGEATAESGADTIAEQWVVALPVGADEPAGVITIDELPEVRVEVVALSAGARGEAVLAAAALTARGVDAASLGAILNPAIGWPSERWRAMLIMRAINPQWMPVVGEAGSGPGVLRRVEAADPVIDALAAQTQAEWAHAIGRLAAVDEALAARLSRTVLGLVRFDLDRRATHVPVWPATEDEAALRMALMNPAADGAALVAAAAGWLETRVRQAVVWVVDDAGGLGPEATPTVARVGVANLRDRPIIAWASAAVDDPLPDDLEALPERTARLEDLALDIDPDVRQRTLVGAGPAPMRPVVMHLGSEVAAQKVASSPRVVLPPGLTIGPLLGDWTMASWLSGSAAPPPAVGVASADAWATAARVLRVVGVEGGGWSVMVQANLPAVEDGPGAGVRGAEPAAGGDAIEVWFGVSGKPSAVIRVLSDGRAEVVLGAADVAERLAVRWTEARSGVRSWRVSVPVPASAIERGERLRIALVRVDERGVRSAWPRAMMPWQREPGRALLDLGGWDAGVEVGP